MCVALCLKKCRTGGTMLPRLHLKKLSLLILTVYLLFTCYGAYVLFYQKGDREGSNNIKDAGTSKSLTAETAGPQRAREPTETWNQSKTLPGHDINVNDRVREEYAVEIWSRAGVGQYTWEHILGASLEPRLGGVWNYGYKKEGNIAFTFRSGQGVVPSKVPKEVENLVLVLNGRAPDKLDFIHAWLDYLDAFPQLRNVGLMLIGSEECDNDWVLPYMTSRKGPLQFLFVVYDSLLVDNARIYQWPLGVATYRGFPVVDSSKLDLRASRRYRCNFMGTVYPNSSRELLLQVIQKYNLDDYCYVKTRKSWIPAESEETRIQYEEILAESDLTLSPVGMNTECYRIYEAVSYGSIPVIEDVQTPGHCASEPLRLLKQFQAPFIYLQDWHQLPQLLHEEAGKTPLEISERRMELLRWYGRFRTKLKQVFLKTVQGSFFPT